MSASKNWPMDISSEDFSQDDRLRASQQQHHVRLKNSTSGPDRLPTCSLLKIFTTHITPLVLDVFERVRDGVVHGADGPVGKLELETKTSFY